MPNIHEHELLVQEFADGQNGKSFSISMAYECQVKNEYWHDFSELRILSYSKSR